MEVEKGHEFEIKNVNLMEEGRRVGLQDFDIVRMIGQGSFGKVFKSITKLKY